MLRREKVSFIRNRSKTKENSYALAFECSLYFGDLYWEDKLAVLCLSVCLSVPLSWFLVSGRKTARDIRTKFAEWIDSPGGRVLLHF